MRVSPLSPNGTALTRSISKRKVHTSLGVTVGQRCAAFFKHGIFITFLVVFPHTVSLNPHDHPTAVTSLIRKLGDSRRNMFDLDGNGTDANHEVSCLTCTFCWY